MATEKRRVGITATGAALPERCLTNFDLEKIVDTSDEWIVSRTGIRERRIVEAGQATSDLSAAACLQALERGGLSPLDVDLIILATVTPDQHIPAAAALIQAKIGATRAAAFDINAGCSGFVYALSIGQQFIESSMYRNVLVIGGDVLSSVTNWEDRSTCVLFGDGAGAALLQRVEGSRGFLAANLGTDGTNAEMLIIPAGGSHMPASEMTVKNNLHCIQMNGNEVFKFAVRIITEQTQDLLNRAGKTVEELDHLFLHQANLRIIDSARKKLNLSPERVPVNIERYGNMSAATIPVALNEAVESGRVKTGDLVAMVAFGSGLTWAGTLMEW